MTRHILAMLIGLLLCQVMALAQPRPGADSELALRAQSAIAGEDFTTALPILQRLAVAYKDDARALAGIEEQIRLCQRNIAKGNGRPATQPVEPRKPHTRPLDGQVLTLSIKELGNFDYDPDRGGNIPADVLALSGSKLRLTGYMIPMDQTDKITKFAMVPSLFACCFGQPPQIQHTIVVSCPEGKSVAYYPDELSVEGILKVQEKKDDGYVVSVFEMQADSVKPAAK